MLEISWRLLEVVGGFRVSHGNGSGEAIRNRQLRPRPLEDFSHTRLPVMAMNLAIQLKISSKHLQIIETIAPGPLELARVPLKLMYLSLW